MLFIIRMWLVVFGLNSTKIIFNFLCNCYFFFKAESPEDYNQLKRIDDSVDRKSLKQLRLMKKILRNDDLSTEEKRIAINAIED